MPNFFIVLPVVFPILAGLVLLFFPEMSKKKRNIYTFVISVINMAMVLSMVFSGKTFEFTLLHFIKNVDITFRFDGLGRLFAVLVSVMWPFSLLYGYEYMEHEERQGKFFGFFVMTLGSVLGIAFAKDIFTMYMFYELLTLLTFPLVMHEMTDDAMKAGRSYLAYMLGGAAFSFVGMIIIMNYAPTLEFILGGVGIGGDASKSVMVFVFFMMFCGFSVKAAMMPFGKWLVQAAVAPMPVTALLHAVAVVKAGAFAIIRLIYYTFGADYLYGTWAQYAVLLLCAFTIIYGSSMAVKETHLKRRLAYSTISNLSYVLFGACIMTPFGMYASLTHMIVHAVTKIGMFFCVGAIMHVTGKSYIYEIDNLGRRMKAIFICFTLTSFSLIGVPQFMGFISKINLLGASLETKNVFAYIGAFAIIISALLTAIYLLNIIIRAYFPKDNKNCDNFEACHDPGWKMLTPITLSAACVLIFGIFWEPLSVVLKNIAQFM